MTTLPTLRGADLPPLGWQHATALDVAKIQPVTDSGFIKPHGGLWTATLTVDADEVVVDTSWASWCRSEGFANPTAPVTVVIPDRDATVYVIDTVADLKALEEAFYHPSPLGVAMWPQLSWERVATELDSIWLTDAGQWATRFSQPGLYGWDCETVLWLKPRFTVGATVTLGQEVPW